jgi:hypothetical protein
LAWVDLLYRSLALLAGWSLPSMFQAPHRASTVWDFWRRWNTAIQGLLTAGVYRPLRKLTGWPRLLAALATFAASAALHLYPLALNGLPAASLYRMAFFFLLQPLAAAGQEMALARHALTSPAALRATTWLWLAASSILFSTALLPA